ncbi:histidine kinase [Massilia sp. FT127W]|uniref:Histidine kinase n=2 Tax=Pseudoduganella aquatica TaxID=2660641 RepID=A0A7X4HGU5_9BURK|nr:cache domain-containing protein [Pseudoduganella aquatica]MYN10920.1 histidine kinase [Pseudoduganella aquatica]
MKRRLMLLTLATTLLLAQLPARAAERGNADEAMAMAKKAIAYLKAHGKEKAFAEINDPRGQFTDRDLYVVVYDLNGKNLAHGQNPRMIGKDLIDIRDGDGKYYMRERLEIAKTKGKGWQDYKFLDPLTKKIEPKSMYIEKVDDLIIGCGIYKPQ